MKKLACLSILALVFINVFSQNQYTPYNEQNFNRVYQKALELNKNRFKNLNIIQIGDTVLLPARIGAGTEAWIADAPAIHDKHDCIWYITQRYCHNGLVTYPVDTIKVKPVPPSISIPVKAGIGAGNIIGILAFLLLCGVIAYLLLRKKPASPLFDRNIAPIRNSDSNPVIPGGLSNEPATALAQINAAYPNRPRALKVQRVVLVAPEGVFEAEVVMTFSDGSRRSIIRAGEQATRVEREGNVVDYYRQHCGNLFGETYQGGYNLPQGWSFQLVNPESELIVSETTEKKEEPADKGAAQPAGTPIDPFLPSAQDVINILDAMNKNNNHPLVLKYGTFEGTFEKTKKQNVKKQTPREE